MTAGIQASDSPTKEPLRQQTFALKSSRRLPCTSMKTKSKFWATKKLNFITPISRNVEKFSLNSLELDRRQGVHVLSMIRISPVISNNIKSVVYSWQNGMAYLVLYTWVSPLVFNFSCLLLRSVIHKLKFYPNDSKLLGRQDFVPQFLRRLSRYHQWVAIINADLLTSEIPPWLLGYASIFVRMKQDAIGVRHECFLT